MVKSHQAWNRFGRLDNLRAKTKMKTFKTNKEEILKDEWGRKLKPKRVSKSCMNCNHVDICVFRMKIHQEFVPIFRFGISSYTLEKIYKVFAGDCKEYKKIINS